MYQFLYDYNKPKYRKNAILLYMDTDSFIIEIKTKNIFEDMKEDLHLFDTSDYQKSHPCYSDKNEKRVGKFKDELKGVPISEECGLRSKMYAYKYNNINKELNQCNLKEEKEIIKI